MTSISILYIFRRFIFYLIYKLSAFFLFFCCCWKLIKSYLVLGIFQFFIIFILLISFRIFITDQFNHNCWFYFWTRFNLFFYFIHNFIILGLYKSSFSCCLKYICWFVLYISAKFLNASAACFGLIVLLLYPKFS